MLKIGLTGGIGSGKSTVAHLFAEKGVAVIDADTIARELVEPGQPALQAIVAAFGQDSLLDGRLNRAFMRERIYTDQRAKQALEAILHPLVYQALTAQAATVSGPYCILAVPLLLETGGQDSVDRILLVDCPPALQYARVRQRDGLDDDAIARIIAAQASRDSKRALAHDIIDNSGACALLPACVNTLHLRYLALAQKHGKNDGLLHTID